MAKKISQSSLKISKNDHKKQHQLNSLIKVLRPKVYITDSSSFKNLVQELTGNGASIISTISSLPPPCPVQPAAAVPVIEINEEDQDICNFQDSSNTDNLSSFESSDLSSHAVNMFTPLDYNYSSSDEVGGLQQQQPPPFDDQLQGSFSDVPSHVNQIDLLQYRNVESWLLDVDPFSCNYDGYVPMNMYDYNLSSII